MILKILTSSNIDTKCKYGRPLGRSRSSCVKARLVRPQEFCFDSRLSDWVDRYGFLWVVMCLRAIKEEIKLLQKRKLIIFALPRFFTKKEMDSSILVRQMEALYYHGVKRTEVCLLHFRREDSGNYLNGRILEKWFIYLFTSFSGHRPAQRECARTGLIGLMQGAIPAESHNP